MAINFGMDPGEMGDFPNLVFCPIDISGDYGNSKFMGKDSILFHKSGMDEEPSSSTVKEDWGVDDFILSFSLACNRKSNGEQFIPIISYKYRRESQCSQRRGGTLS